MKPDICISHAFCPDGTCAAYIVKKKYPEVRIIYASHDKPIAQLAEWQNKKILFVDFVPGYADLDAIVKQASKIFIIDHHPFVDLERYRENSDEQVKKEESKITYVYNSKDAACVMVHKILYPNVEVPWYYLYVSDRDTWTFALPDSKAINEGLYRMRLVNRNGLDKLEQGCVSQKEVLEVGIVALKRTKLEIKRDASQHKKYELTTPNAEKYIVAVLKSDTNLVATRYKSEVGHVLAGLNGVDFAIIMRCDYDQITKTEIYHCNCRSRQDYDLGPIVAQFMHNGKPGGGHANAAKFLFSKDAFDIYFRLLDLEEQLAELTIN